MVDHVAPSIRTARTSDVPAIKAFTTDTFTWGDYVPDLVEDWVADDEGVVMVAVDTDDRPIAMARAVFLTETEIWSHAARVHPDHRGRGIAGQLADALLEWGRSGGGQIARLLIEDDNLASINHITKSGFTRAASVVRATRSVGAASPNPEGNGGRRTKSAVQAKPGKAHDLPLVRASWTTSEAGRSLRGLLGIGWRFHRLRDVDIEDAARRGGLWEIGSSWAITDTIAPVFLVGLLDTTEDDAHDVIRALIDTANNRGAETFAMWTADTVWLIQAARRAGCDIEGYGIWAKPL